MRHALWLLSSVFVVGCAHAPLDPAALERLERPAFIARIEEGAGPRSTVFRDDGASYADRLKKLDTREADRRLAQKLEKGSDKEKSINRYQLADTLRAQVLADLPKGAPWSRVAPPAQVATLLESFLVDEVPANAPDVTRLSPLGVDSIIEIVVEDYGLRSQGGKAGIFLYGTARLYRIDGGTLYRRSFFSDELKAGLDGLDPFEVAKRPSIYAARMRTMLEAIAKQIALDLSPGLRASQRDLPPVKDQPIDKPKEEDPL